MANFIEKLGLEFLTETEEQVISLTNFIAQNGKPIIGYSGFPYINHHFGDAQFILRTEIDPEQKHFEIVGMDTHSSGNCVWDVRLTGMNVTRKDADALECRCVVERTDGGSPAVVNIVNADVLPDFQEGAALRLQMIAFPSLIEYFPDEDAYAEAQEADRNGKKWLLGDGAVFPSGLMKNHDPDSDQLEADEDLDDLTLIRGTVKALYHGDVQIGEDIQNLYIRCIIGTSLGDLEIVHTIDDVKESQRGSIRVGALVSGVFTLSGDAAIYEYENGFVLDEAHDLAILRATFAGADAERMRYVFAEDAVYEVGYSGEIFRGRDAILERLKSVSESAADPYFAHMATIVSVDPGGEALPYGVGKRCIVLASGKENHYESIAFPDIDADGRIARLVTTAEGRYHFQIDKRPKARSPLDDIELPDSVVEPIVLRAQFHELIDTDLSPQDVLDRIKDGRVFEGNARQMLAEMPSGNEKDSLKNLFGYLFAKSIEYAFARKQRTGLFQKRLVVRYSPDEAWAGVIHTLLKPKQQERIEAAMQLGKQFAKDFALFHPFGKPHNETYEDDLLQALMVVQQIGVLYEPRCMK